MEKLTIDKGLLRETEVVQHQLTALLKCDVCHEPREQIYHGRVLIEERAGYG